MGNAPYDICNYSQFWQGRDYEDNSERIAIKKLLGFVHIKDSLLDIGGGYGRLATLYAPIFGSCLILDPSLNLLNEAKNNLKSFKNIEFQKGTSESLPKGKFGVVLMVRVAHHLFDIQHTLGAIHNALKPDGYLIIEYANKIHFMARIKALFKGNLGYINNQETVDIRSEQAKKEGKIIFVNHHPKRIEELLKKSGFEVIDKLSVSNFRHPLTKKIIPNNILLFFESLFQKPLSKIYFGPSIFYLCRKI